MNKFLIVIGSLVLASAIASPYVGVRAQVVNCITTETGNCKFHGQCNASGWTCQVHLNICQCRPVSR